MKRGKTKWKKKFGKVRDLMVIVKERKSDFTWVADGEMMLLLL